MFGANHISYFLKEHRIPKKKEKDKKEKTEEKVAGLSGKGLFGAPKGEDLQIS